MLRAAVYAAFDARDAGDPEAYAAALERVVFVHRAWPLIEYEQAMLRVADELALRRLEFEQWVVETADRLCPLSAHRARRSVANGDRLSQSQSLSAHRALSAQGRKP